MKEQLEDLSLSIDWLEDKFGLFIVSGKDESPIDNLFEDKDYKVVKLNLKNFEENFCINKYMDYLYVHGVESHIWLNLSDSDDKLVSRILASLNRKRSRLEAKKKHVYIQVSSEYAKDIVTYAPDLLTIRESIIFLDK